MLKSKTFVKKTRKGGVMKIVREQYLRDDVWCGVKCCSRCCQTEPVLDAKPERSSSVFNFPYFIVPDTNIAVHQVCCMWYKHRRTGDKNLGGLTPFRPKTIFY